jgi:hypothetical protein
LYLNIDSQLAPDAKAWMLWFAFLAKLSVLLSPIMALLRRRQHKAQKALFISLFSCKPLRLPATVKEGPQLSFYMTLYPSAALHPKPHGISNEAPLPSLLIASPSCLKRHIDNL